VQATRDLGARVNVTIGGRVDDYQYLEQTRFSPRASASLRLTDGLEWRASYARFDVDGATVLETDRPPRGPLGFVAWVDNLWAVATPRGRFGWGLLDAEAQWMDLGLLRIEALSVTQG
ncbi:MAG: TonB-dependent receptor domain-containing protein, partial [Roseiflexaceae bacterium]